MPTPAYLASANALCAREVARLHALRQPQSPEEAIGYLPHALTIMRREDQGLEKLARRDPPSGDSGAQFEAALREMRELAGTLDTFMRQLRGGTIAISSFATVQSRSVALQRQLDQHFRQAGLPRCAD